ncbi:MAG: NTPase family protein [Satyrvirus sp.]|uniref:NTPase family protein n=1 Tax=Satyrvirus sp. TaxID=2487771 RepID=A0A3G5AEE0_9VIRU|nr:MAG: NTPase family protein [Satyrvirus sp.]
MQYNSNNDANKNNIIVGPDYSEIIKHQTNSAIVQAFITLLFSNSTQFGARTVLVMIRNMIILILIKILLEESKTFLDKFKFTNLNVFKYIYQRIKYSENCYDIVLVCGKWTYNDKYISINTLTPFLELKSIFIAQPSTYYYNYMSYIIKVIVTPNKITFCVPDMQSMVRYIDTDIILRNEEILFGGKTTMWKMNISPSNIFKMEPVQLAFAFPTKNYRNLEETIKNHALIDSALKLPYTPFCVNFDGDPGTGKTTFGSYIAQSGIFDRIVICNLVSATHLTFTEIITNIERQITITSSKERKNG